MTSSIVVKYWESNPVKSGATYSTITLRTGNVAMVIYLPVLHTGVHLNLALVS